MKGLRADAGTTIFEVIVVMLLTSTIGGTIVTSFIATAKSTEGYRARVTDLSATELAIRTFDRDARMAIRPAAATPAFRASSSSTSTSFFVNQTAGGPVLVTYRAEVVNGVQRLIRQVTRPAGTGPYTWPASGTRTRVLVQNLGPRGSVSFRYFAVGSTGLPVCASPAESGCAIPLVSLPALAALDGVGSIEIVVRTQSSVSVNSATELRSRVRIVNAGFTASA